MRTLAGVLLTNERPVFDRVDQSESVILSVILPGTQALVTALHAPKYQVQVIGPGAPRKPGPTASQVNITQLVIRPWLTRDLSSSEPVIWSQNKGLYPEHTLECFPGLCSLFSLFMCGRPALAPALQAKSAQTGCWGRLGRVWAPGRAGAARANLLVWRVSLVRPML